MKRSVLLIFILTGFCSFLTAQNFKKIADIPYTQSQVSERQKLDVYIPSGSDELMPCLVWIHGGAWLAGSKDILPQETDTLLDHGYVIASIGYRLSNEAIFPAQIQDCKAAIRFLKANGKKFGIDSSRIAVSGASAGGHLAALLGTSGGVNELEDKSMGSPEVSSKVKAVVDFYGPTNFLIMDLLPDHQPDSCPGPVLHLVPDSPESLLLGCTITECPEKVEVANPITYVSADDPPFMIIHGTFDCTVTPLSSNLLYRELKMQEIPIELLLIPHAGHGGPEFTKPDVKAKVLKFLDQVMK